MNTAERIQQLIESTKSEGPGFDLIPVHKKSDNDFRRLAGMKESYTEWTHQPKGEFSLTETRIRRAARLLEDERYSSPLEFTFDPQLVEEFMEAAASRPMMMAPLAQQHHAAHASTHSALQMGRGKDAGAAYNAHKNAAQLHHNAAQQLGAAGFHDLAAQHASHAQAHERHAEHHAMRAAQAKGLAPAAKPAKPEAHKDPFPQSAAPKAKPEVHADPFKPSAHAQAAHGMNQAVKALSKDKSVSHKELADTHHKASMANLTAAVHAFKSGDHTGALRAFHTAIKHATKKTQHEKMGFEKAMNPPKGPAGGGARAAAGRTNVPHS